MSYKFDIVTCVSNSHKDISIKSIRSLIRFSGAARYFVISSEDNNHFIRKNFLNSKNLILLNEDELFENFKKNDLAEIIKKKGGDPSRSGWYFQQFLKMEVARKSFISDYYLIWDCDTIMLERIDFFTKKGRAIFNVSKQYHKPYFDCINRMGLKNREKYSFISEHLMIKTDFMRELIKFLDNKDQRNILWAKKVLNFVNIEDLSKSGFSEFETYGTYLLKFHKSTFSVKSIKSTRKGYSLFGDPGNKKTFICLLIYGYKWATFELWDKDGKRNLIKKIIFLTIKFLNLKMSELFILFFKFSKKENKIIENANYLAKKIRY